MNGKIVDARGLLCPQPLILTKKALQDAAAGDVVTILIDNETSVENVVRFLHDNNVPVSTDRKDGVFTLSVTPTTTESLSKDDPQSYCTTSPTRPHVICFRRNTMGVGDDDLGTILAKALINTIKEIEPLPGTVLFYNAGIFLTLNDSPVLPPLRELAEKGVRILVCGTCLDFYGKKAEVGVGIVSNMYDVLQALTDADHVVMP